MDWTEALNRAHGFAIDSRFVEPGFVFFAIRGQKHDGHQFLKEVAAKKPLCAIVEKTYTGPTQGLELIRVENVVQTLQKMAQEKIRKAPLKVVAITGSVGKTTTKEFLSYLLSSQYHVMKTEGNANSQIGFPLTLLSQPQKGDLLVAEMGMSYPGEISRLVEIAPPEIAILTRIGRAHIGNFPTGLDGIARAKAEIFSHPKTKLGIINAQARAFKAVEELRCPLVTFGVREAADFVLEEEGYIRTKEVETDPFPLPFKERHLLEDFLAAAVAAHLLGVSWEAISRASRFLIPPPLRFEKKEKSGVFFISDCYNANPESMAAALHNLPHPGLGGKRIAVLGEMADLGSHSEKEHCALAHTAMPFIDHFLCFGRGCLPMMSLLNASEKPAEFFTDLAKLKEVLFDLAKPGDVVLIKGSRSNGLWQLLD